MATSIDFNTRVLGHSSDRVLDHSDDFRAARKVPLETNRAADFHVPVQFIQQLSVSFIHIQSSEKNRSMKELSLLFLNTISRLMHE